MRKVTTEIPSAPYFQQREILSENKNKRLASPCTLLQLQSMASPNPSPNTKKIIDDSVRKSIEDLCKII